jgi:hypothetical protein
VVAFVTAGKAMDRQGSMDWTAPRVAQYFQSAAEGIPYIDCPVGLRPSDASPDSWWVIYALDFRGGTIVEGYLIEDTLLSENSILTLWCFVGILGWMIVITSLSFLWIMGAVVTWASAIVLTFYLGRRRRLITNRRWIAFPVELTIALQADGERAGKAEAEKQRKHTIGEGVGRIAGGISGLFIEASLGKAAGKVSEIAVEAAFKHLAEKVMSRGKQATD